MHINSKVEQHITSSLAFSGLCILEKTIMLHLRRDLFVAGHEADLHWAPIETFLRGLSPRVKVYEVGLEGRSAWARVAARSDHMLADRIRWITGMEVVALREYQPEVRTAVPAGRQDAQAQNEIPDYPCQARTDALAKRGLSDTKFVEQDRKRAS